MEDDRRVRLGVIGLGLIAQVVHLPNLARLSHLFEVTAVCDLSASLADSISRALPGRPAATTDWHELVSRRDVDAVLILTPGAHAALVSGALKAGKHVLSEKPLGVARAEATDLAAMAEERRLVLQVGYMKMYDPVIEPTQEALSRIGDIRLVRVTVRHPTEERQVSGLPVRRASDVDPDLVRAAQLDEADRTTTAIGDVPASLAIVYRDILLGSIVHELSLLRALGIGLPARFSEADMWPFDPASDAPATPSIWARAELEAGSRLELTWLWLPDYPSYQERVTVLGTAGAVTIDMPEPYGSNRGARLEVRRSDGPDETVSLTRAERDSGFLRELGAFHASVTGGAPMIADASAALEDTVCLQALLRAIADCFAISLGGEAARS